MSIKSYLRALIESAFTSKKAWIGQQAYPSSTRVEYTVSITSGWSSILTMPCDGWFMLKGLNSNAGTNMYAEVSNITSGVWLITHGIYAKVAVPVKKGDKLNYGLYATAASDFTACLIKSVGEA